MSQFSYFVSLLLRAMLLDFTTQVVVRKIDFARAVILSTFGL